jgi:hypothetical protein
MQKEQETASQNNATAKDLLYWVHIPAILSSNRCLENGFSLFSLLGQTLQTDHSSFLFSPVKVKFTLQPAMKAQR